MEPREKWKTTTPIPVPGTACLLASCDSFVSRQSHRTQSNQYENMYQDIIELFIFICCGLPLIFGSMQEMRRDTEGLRSLIQIFTQNQNYAPFLTGGHGILSYVSGFYNNEHRKLAVECGSYRITIPQGTIYGCLLVLYYGGLAYFYWSKSI